MLNYFLVVGSKKEKEKGKEEMRAGIVNFA